MLPNDADPSVAVVVFVVVVVVVVNLNLNLWDQYMMWASLSTRIADFFFIKYYYCLN